MSLRSFSLQKRTLNKSKQSVFPLIRITAASRRQKKNPMMCGFLMMSTVVMLGRFAVMVGSLGLMFCCLPTVLGCFFSTSL
jgi:hypothetical protein